MAAGYFCGKTYSRIQVFAVFLLSVGVSLAAWSDSKDKVNARTTILFLARPNQFSRKPAKAVLSQSLTSDS
jgi:drug/metabolite transporter (DMT)-like permease